MKGIHKIKGIVRNYPWGGFTYIPQLLNQSSPSSEPCAEYWMGAHDSAPAEFVESDTESKNLAEAISANPLETLGEKVADRFGRLPYLMKVLDVKDMLSIQVHPTQKAAEAGFKEENDKGIPLNAAHRNYKDDNHKPELMLALSKFWLLHGFQQPKAVAKLLETRPCYQSMLRILSESGLRDLFIWAISAPESETKAITASLLETLEKQPPSDKSHPEYWIYKWTRDPEATHKGLLVILLMNVMHVEPGEAVFQGAGIPHAYLEGQNIEIMANSDNVLRGGLTPKHMDAEELVKHTLFDPIDPTQSIIAPLFITDQEHSFPTPVEDFILSEIQLNPGESVELNCKSVEIFLCLEGESQFKNPSNEPGVGLVKGEVCVGYHGTNTIVSAESRSARLFRARVNLR
ncbi:MAG: mannose-6-phosphate isomerase, class I [Opitutales bacterium]|nr:mannose-6-phosphate isomerase, class I [Opitutales bacterium]